MNEPENGRIAAARLRIVTDKKLGRRTPQWVFDLAKQARDSYSEHYNLPTRGGSSAEFISSAAAPPRVLVVDDDDVMLQLITVNLEAAGYEVVAGAFDGQQALGLAIELLPDVITMDIMMPVMDGWTATAHIRRHVPRAAIVVLSARAQATDLYRGFRIGASAYLTKPFSPDELVEVVGAVARGEYLVPARVAALTVKALRSDSDWLSDGSAQAYLSDAELSVLRMVADDVSETDMAERLGETGEMIQRRLTNALAKLQRLAVAREEAAGRG